MCAQWAPDATSQDNGVNVSKPLCECLPCWVRTLTIQVRHLINTEWLTEVHLTD